MYSRRLQPVHQQNPPEEVLSHTPGDYEYLNIVIPFNLTSANNLSNDGIRGTVATFGETRLTPLFEGDTNDYKLSVIRWSIPASLIPIQIIDILQGPGLINQTTYLVAINYLGLDYTATVLWQTQNNKATAPVGDDAQNNKIRFDNYYSLYSYNHLADLINIALASVTTQAIAGGAPLIHPPILIYNGETNLFTLYAPQEFNSDNVNPVSIFFNNALYSNFLNSFPTVETTISPIPSFTITGYYFIVKARLTNVSIINAITYILVEQEFPTLSLLSHLASILMTTKTIPVRSEGISSGIGENDSGFSSANTLSILTDFLIDTEDKSNRNEIIYTPTAQYRYTTLRSSFPIINVDISVYWRDYNNVIRSIYIPENSEISIKMMFEKK